MKAGWAFDVEIAQDLKPALTSTMCGPMWTWQMGKREPTMMARTPRAPRILLACTARRARHREEQGRQRALRPCMGEQPGAEQQRTTGHAHPIVGAAGSTRIIHCTENCQPYHVLCTVPSIMHRESTRNTQAEGRHDLKHMVLGGRHTAGVPWSEVLS